MSAGLVGVSTILADGVVLSDKITQELAHLQVDHSRSRTLWMAWRFPNCETNADAVRKCLSQFDPQALESFGETAKQPWKSSVSDESLREIPKETSGLQGLQGKRKPPALRPH